MTSETTNIAPIQKANRIDYLDILRGLAIFFIFTANIPFFSGIWFFPNDSSLRELNLPTDEVFDFIMYALVDGKFYSIFSLLFGIGCVIQYNNLTSHGKAFAPFFRKRMFWLLVIGLIHLFLLWPGDILTLYAFLGFLLIWFVNKSNKTLLFTATILILFPIINWIFVHLTGIFYPGYFYQKSNEIYQYFGMPLTEFNGNLQPDFSSFLLNTNLSDYFKMGLGNGFVRIARILDEGREFKVFGVFLIGIWAGRNILKDNLLDNSEFLKKVFIIGLVVGLPMNLIRTYLEFYTETSETYLYNIIAYALGTVPLALGYAAGIALLCKKNVSFLNWFKPIGKMALTNYLLQTIISITLFYGIGFNFVGKFGFTIVMGIAVIIFALQIILSRFWLNHFKYGPMEWLWRKLTYGITIKIKK
ncbi:DUF418 domain-containing protein [Litoribaculum gwangyangense]|uniref:DUF418 domain-containing protein n=1 Tax=Litoribaculum gwangyangense TaxID=1130722 RepID=A0ABP9CR71_9FLAO